jgi:hypothetical protein
MTTLKLGTLVLALAAMLALASTAMAKGGGGGATCAQITDFTLTPTYVDGQPAVSLSYSVYNGCVDHENMSSVAADYSNDVTGFAGRAVNMLPYGPSTYGSTWKSSPGVTYTVTITVYTPGGKVAATRTLSATAPAALAPAA